MYSDNASIYPKEQMQCFLDFVHGLLQFNQFERWSPIEALNHPFITGYPFSHYIPIYDESKAY